MMYVLIGLVVVLALISGFEYATLRVVRAERKAEVAELKNANYNIANKCRALSEENAVLTERLARMDNIKGGIN